MNQQAFPRRTRPEQRRDEAELQAVRTAIQDGEIKTQCVAGDRAAAVNLRRRLVYAARMEGRALRTIIKPSEAEPGSYQVIYQVRESDSGA